MWKPNGNMECIDLGFDFCLVKFSIAKDVDKVLKEGPWFIGQHFLAIRQWELDFKASRATLSSAVAWIRSPKLPIEYYNHDILLKIGKVVGPVLHIDSNTIMGARGTRGFRQWDPISPYIFLLCIEFLGAQINSMCENKRWDKIKASKNGPSFSHVFFADDLMLIAKANTKNYEAIVKTYVIEC